MVISRQVFGVLAVLFLISSVPFLGKFPGKIRFSGEISPFQKSTVVRGGGGVAPISRGGSRRRTKAEVSGFPFFHSEEAPTYPDFLEDAFQGVRGQAYEAEEEFTDASSIMPSRKFMANASEAQPAELISNAFYSAQEDLNVATPGQPKPVISIKQPAASFGFVLGSAVADNNPFERVRPLADNSNEGIREGSLNARGLELFNESLGLLDFLDDGGSSQREGQRSSFRDDTDADVSPHHPAVRKRSLTVGDDSRISLRGSLF